VENNMEDKVLTEILMAHADRPDERRHNGEDYLEMFPAYCSELEPLLTIAETVQEALPPVEPAPAFRESLRQRLLVAAQKKAAARNIQLTRPPGRGLLIGAVVGSALSVIGIIALFLRNRAQAKTQSISSG
jgi:hypothetical protein